jgi:hypothetical protein
VADVTTIIRAARITSDAVIRILFISIFIAFFLCRYLTWHTLLLINDHAYCDDPRVVLFFCFLKFFHRRGRDFLDRDIALGVDVAVSRYDSAGSKEDLFKWKIRVKGEVPLN